MSAAIVWFRRDLRLEDNPALSIANERADRVIPVYLHCCPAEEAVWSAGAASRWWLHHSLVALDRSLVPSAAGCCFARARTAWHCCRHWLPRQV